MADNNKNPRRTIWLSETEPLSHYDIWLSKNQHLNSDGEPVSTSGVLRDCDYIFKVWDCGDWHPIVGLNSTALNKINTVLNTGYTTTHDGHDINSSSYLEFHLPLFTSPNSSPQELFDAGTIGNAILEYVTEEEWENIFEGDTFNKVFKKYFKLIINEGDTNIINELLDPADFEYLGGVWADTFSLDDIFPDDATIHIGETELQYDIEDSYEWLAQAKYKYLHGEDDYNLYISAKDIIRIINKYEDDNPDASGIQPSDDFEWRYAGHELVGGIWADRFTIDEVFPDNEDNPSDEEILDSIGWLALAKYKHVSTEQRDEYNLYVSAKDIIKIITLYQEDNPDEPGITPGGGAIIDPEVIYRSFFNSPTVLKGWRDDPNSAWKPRFMLPGSNLPENRGKFLKLTDNLEWWDTHTSDYNDTNNALEWVSIDEIYPVLSADNNAYGPKYVINGGGKDGTYLNWLGEWTDPNVGNEYYGVPPIYVDQANNYISIAPYSGGSGEVYLCSENGNVHWNPVDTGLTYEVLGEHSSADDYYVIRGGSDDKYYLNGNGEWAEPFGDTTYSGGIGITISSEDNTNYINIDTSDADEGLVLAFAGDDDGIKWIDVLEYDEGDGIEITDNNVIKGLINVNNGSYIARTNISFNCVIEGSTNPLTGIEMILDEDQDTKFILRPYSYIKTEIGYSLLDAVLSFTLQNQTNFMKGNPVYVLIEVSNSPSSVKIDTNNSYGTASVINTNNAIIEDNDGYSYLNISKFTAFLCTLQFGILKVEPLESISSSNNS